ncbi:hypothetical protein [Tsukamurella strandjordii]|uniref:hypothetical protein n=1 Tax=Tsukamurella strandjordii TaxID=147577 RepID=UPI0031DB93D0
MALLFIAGIIAGIVLTAFVLTAWIATAASHVNRTNEERSVQRANLAPLGGDTAIGAHHRSRPRPRAA